MLLGARILLDLRQCFMLELTHRLHDGWFLMRSLYDALKCSSDFTASFLSPGH
jgi:hypothetical protein